MRSSIKHLRHLDIEFLAEKTKFGFGLIEKLEDQVLEQFGQPQGLPLQSLQLRTAVILRVVQRSRRTPLPNSLLV